LVGRDAAPQRHRAYVRRLARQRLYPGRRTALPRRRAHPSAKRDQGRAASVARCVRPDGLWNSCRPSYGCAALSGPSLRSGEQRRPHQCPYGPAMQVPVARTVSTSPGPATAAGTSIVQPAFSRLGVCSLGVQPQAAQQPSAARSPRPPSAAAPPRIEQPRTARRWHDRRPGQSPSPGSAAPPRSTTSPSARRRRHRSLPQ